MSNKMLIDAAHPEETRVVVLRGNRVEEFDFESANRKQLRGNIYLAKVTRVEPSRQAAFVDYGGNRHGFLAFSEIHPDYYQIPVADRQALIAEEERAHRDAEDEIERRASRRRQRHEAHGRRDDRRTRPLEGGGNGEGGENGESAPAEGDETVVQEAAETSADHPDTHQAEAPASEPAAEAPDEPAAETATHEPTEVAGAAASSAAAEQASEPRHPEHASAEPGEPAAQASAETEAALTTSPDLAPANGDNANGGNITEVEERAAAENGEEEVFESVGDH